jgi:AcrR family transcriptional regulator
MARNTSEEYHLEAKLDRRVARTRRMLADALMTLILERGYEDITIQQITERADLRRATFYLHYTTKEELLLAALEETFNALAQQLEPLMQGDSLGGKTQLATYEVIFNHVDEHRDLYRIVLSVAPVARRIRVYLANHVLTGLKPDGDVPAEVMANYIAGAELALIMWWLEQDTPYTAGQMAAMTQRLVLKGTNP